MKNKKLTLSAVASLLIATNLYSSQDLTSIEITSPSINTSEIDASFVTEIYTQEDIKKTTSKNLYDFLNSSTSIVTVPNNGNDLVHSIDMRGYGTTNGYKSIVVTLNGRRLNSIDSLPQFLSTININNIEKIEIIKGGSSVEFGDGANAGSINIITKSKNDNIITTYLGNNGTKYSSLSLGYNNEKFILNGFIDNYSTDGSRSINNTNTKTDSKWSKNKKIDAIFFPTNDLELSIGKSFSKISNNYSNSLTLNEFNNSINNYGSAGTSSKVFLDSNTLTSGIKYYINKNYTIEANYNKEDKLNRNITYSFETNYDYQNYGSKINYIDDTLKLSVGFDAFEGEAKGATDLTNKDNIGGFITANYNLTNTTMLTLGSRIEKVKYSYTNANQKYDTNLKAFDIGINKKLSETSSIYANINRSFQTPDIDMFFTYPAPTYTKTFNNFLKPTISKNINIGYNNFTEKNKLKVGVFYSKLKDEIYYLQDNINFVYVNTNFDKTKKYGFELFDKYQLTDFLSTSINYNYIIAKIDEEDSMNNAYNGKYMPGVSKHNITLNLEYIYDNFTTNLTHKYRSEAFAGEDFSNTFSQKQKAYNSTDLSINYKYNSLNIFAKINNIFNQKNGIWLRDNVITPTNFETTYLMGLNYKF